MRKMSTPRAADSGGGPPVRESAWRRGASGLDPYTGALLALILVMCILYTAFFFGADLPFRKASADTFPHMGLLRTVEDRMGLGEELDPDLIPGLYSGNERSGINYVAMALIASLPGASSFTALYILGLFGIAVFLSGIFILARTLSGSCRVAFLAAVFSLVLCSTEAVVRGSSFSFVEVLACAHYASVVSIGLMMLALSLNIRYLAEGDWRHYILQLVLAALAFNIHLLTGIMYFLVLLILVAVNAAWDRRLSRRHLLLLSLIPATLLLVSLWPLYHWWVILKEGDVVLEGPYKYYSTFDFVFQSSVIFFIGLPFLFKKERGRVFLLAWTLIFALISVSFLLPLSVAFHWRFAFVVRVPLVIGLAMGVGLDIWRLRRWRAFAIPVILGIVGVFVVASMVINVQRFKKVMHGNDLEAVEEFADSGEGGMNLVAQPKQGCVLMGISDYSVYSVPTARDERNERLLELYYTPVMGEWEGFLREYGFQRVLVNRSPSLAGTALLLNGTLLERNEGFDLYGVDPDALDTEIVQRIKDRKLERSETAGGFFRFDDWAYFQQAGKGMIGIERAEGDGETGEPYMLFSSDAPGGELVLANRGYIEVDPNVRYRIDVDYRMPPEAGRLYLLLYQYSEASPEGEVAYERKKVFGEPGAWTQRRFIVGPGSDPRARFVLSEETRYVKIGLLVCFESAGQMGLRLLNFSSARVALDRENP